MFSPKTRKELKDAINMCLKLSDDCSKGPHGPIGTWDVSQVTDMSDVFSSHSSFNGDISNWDVSRVTDMGFMFEWAGSFNGDISNWDVSQVTDMQGMFAYARSFNGDISNWDVSQVTDMQGMFEYATSFNVDISNWDVSRATNMNGMFYYATSFNVDISNWDVSRVTNMNLMFVGVWSKITSKHCGNTRDDRSFSTLAAAKAFCLKQGPSACSGVYDDSCDGKGNFYACKVGTFQSSFMGSCIYTAAKGVFEQCDDAWCIICVCIPR